MQKLLILLIILAAALPLFYINKWLQNLVMPRKSFVRLALYFVVVLELVFLYTFLVITIISRLFPVPKG